MACAIAFRGPDQRQETHQPGASFAFSLLKTGPAPQSDSQPFTLDGKVWLVGDVRLDRRCELIDSLGRQSQRVGIEATDEEIVLLAWKLWRDAGVRRVFFEEMYGDFGFAIWEPTRKEFHCFRDVMGVRPFYYCSKDGAFSFSNTLEALHNAPGFSSELDREYIGDFLLHSWCPRPEHTIYKSIRRLPAGHWLTSAPGNLRVKRFQGLPVEELLFLRRGEEYVEAYRELIEKAVSDRLPRDDAAIFLSGGMDSSSIAATVCTLRKKAGEKERLHAVTADMLPLFPDEEGERAATVAKYLGISFELSHHGDSTPFLSVQDLPMRFPEPMANPFRSIYQRLYQQSAMKSRVVFLGYGGDDVLTGRTASYLAHLAKNGHLQEAIASFAAYVGKNWKLPPLRMGVQAWFRKRLGVAQPAPQFPSWLAPSFEGEFGLRERWEELQRSEDPVHAVHAVGYRGLAGTFWPNALDQEDAAFTGLPLQARFPLFDYRLLCFLLKLPTLPWCVNKEIMRRAARGALPEATLKRAKKPLAQDPLQLHIKRGLWQFDQLPRPLTTLAEFVDWRRFLEHIQGSPGRSAWFHIPPIALDLWLKSIETHSGIQ
jgi:asparagine synthase (glutamine-hydrolysing)